ncbi:MAG: insulinase family protein, partial [Bdellovibrionales bacterium]|nr:insulinase family protein [Bdellovibrionales bacterium]
VAGDVDHDLVVKLIDKSLGRSRKNGKLSRIRRIKPKYRPFTEVRARPSEQVHILVGVPSGSFKDPLRFESYIVNALLGGGMTSRLYQKVREERGLVYSIYSQLQSFTDSGLMMVYAGASEKNAPKVLSVMYKELKRLIDKSLGKRDLEFFKTQVKGAILLGSDDMESRMNSIAVNEIVFGEYKPVDEIIDQIDRITLNSIHQYLHTYFNLKEACVMLMGDLNEEIGKNWVKECFRE